MKIGIIGTGYVGLTTGTCLANLGNDIICLDVDQQKIESLNNSKVPFFEPGLKEMVQRNFKEKRLSFTTDARLTILNSDIIFICVGTPSDEDGSADLKYVYQVAKTIGENMNSYKIIVDKSTVPVGTGKRVKEIIQKQLDERKLNIEFDVVSNPEFLREGQAIYDFLHPDRIVIGTKSQKAREKMNKLYKVLARSNKPILFTDLQTAEMIKYASNSMLATRISFMNMLAPLCEKVGANVKQVARGMGLDNRIGSRFLQAGIGYGGSCFPKDVKALIRTLKQNNCDSSILNSVEKVNLLQKQSLLPKIKEILGDLKGKKIALLGLSFKPKTDDMREAPSIIIAKQLIEEGCEVKGFDPEAMENAKKEIPNIKLTQDSYSAIKDVDLMVLITEWDEFRQIDLEKVKRLMNKPNIIDGRNVYDPKEIKELGFNYVSVGR